MGRWTPHSRHQAPSRPFAEPLAPRPMDIPNVCSDTGTKHSFDSPDHPSAEERGGPPADPDPEDPILCRACEITFGYSPLLRTYRLSLRSGSEIHSSESDTRETGDKPTIRQDNAEVARTCLGVKPQPIGAVQKSPSVKVMIRTLEIFGRSRLSAAHWLVSASMVGRMPPEQTYRNDSPVC